MLSLSHVIQKPKNTQDGKISGITVLKLGEIFNSNVQISYLKGLTKLGKFIKLYTKRKIKFLKKKSMLVPEHHYQKEYIVLSSFVNIIKTF